jgi:hypothetical protein
MVGAALVLGLSWCGTGCSRGCAGDAAPSGRGAASASAASSQSNPPMGARADGSTAPAGPRATSTPVTSSTVDPSVGRRHAPVTPRTLEKLQRPEKGSHVVLCVQQTNAEGRKTRFDCRATARAVDGEIRGKQIHASMRGYVGGEGYGVPVLKTVAPGTDYETAPSDPQPVPNDETPLASRVVADSKGRLFLFVELRR